MNQNRNNLPRGPPNDAAQNGNRPGPHSAKNTPNLAASSNTSKARQFVPIPYTAAEEDRIQGALSKILGPEYVSFRPGGGGQNVSYIEGWKALNLANEIFGFNGWSSELISVQVDFVDSHGSGRVSLGLSVVVRITIKDGTFHEDFGYGFIENAKGKAMAFEKCKKEAFTDGLKRCLRCFGNVLGNCLYDKSIVAKMQKVKLPPPELEADDFHRDPLVVKREHERLRKEKGKEAKVAEEMKAAVPPSKPAVQPSARASHTRANVATAAKDYDLVDFDDLFVFSDDLPAEGERMDTELAKIDEDSAMGDSQLNDHLDDSELEFLRQSSEEGKMENRTDSDKTGESNRSETPGQVFFTSSKKALDIQNTPDVNVPVYDHKFVASSVRRTVDPSKSTKIRRADLPTALTASQINSTRVASPSLAPVIGKRPLGMPPSQRQQPKRLHKDIDLGKAEKENEALG